MCIKCKNQIKYDFIIFHLSVFASQKNGILYLEKMELSFHQKSNQRNKKSRTFPKMGISKKNNASSSSSLSVHKTFYTKRMKKKMQKIITDLDNTSLQNQTKREKEKEMNIPKSRNEKRQKKNIIS